MHDRDMNVHTHTHLSIVFILLVAPSQKEKKRQCNALPPLKKNSRSIHMWPKPWLAPQPPSPPPRRKNKKRQNHRTISYYPHVRSEKKLSARSSDRIASHRMAFHLIIPPTTPATTPTPIR
jgi:hypothetical protein